MSAPTTKIGFLGTGDISDLHAAGGAACPGAELAGVWNRSAEKGRRKATAFGCRFYDTAEALVADPGIDAVFVLTLPPSNPAPPAAGERTGRESNSLAAPNPDASGERHR